MTGFICQHLYLDLQEGSAVFMHFKVQLSIISAAKGASCANKGKRASTYVSVANQLKNESSRLCAAKSCRFIECHDIID